MTCILGSPYSCEKPNTYKPSAILNFFQHLHPTQKRNWGKSVAISSTLVRVQSTFIIYILGEDVCFVNEEINFVTGVKYIHAYIYIYILYACIQCGEKYNITAEESSLKG